MQFEFDAIYHVYNRGNERQKIFFNRNNYLYFLKKVRKEWLPYADILAYCLMPNHFHFILHVKSPGANYITTLEKQTNIQCLSKGIGKTLSSYTRAINIEQNRTGNLFQKKTNAKNMSLYDSNYLLFCLHYIHSNPVASGMVSDESLWEFSSFRDYYKLRNGTLCNKELFYQLSGVSESELPMTIGLTEEIIKSFY